jgi:hypothetical protein
MKQDEDKLPDDQFFDALHRCRWVANLDRKLTKDEAQQYRQDLQLVMEFAIPTETPFLDNSPPKNDHSFCKWNYHDKQS